MYPLDHRENTCTGRYLFHQDGDSSGNAGTYIIESLRDRKPYGKPCRVRCILSEGCPGCAKIRRPGADLHVNYLDSKSIFNMLIFKGIPFFHFRFYQLFGQAQMPGMDVCVLASQKYYEILCSGNNKFGGLKIFEALFPKFSDDTWAPVQFYIDRDHIRHLRFVF